jgi:hypothetical protein
MRIEIHLSNLMMITQGVVLKGWEEMSEECPTRMFFN